MRSFLRARWYFIMGFDAEARWPLNGPLSSPLNPLYSLMEAGVSGPPLSRLTAVGCFRLFPVSCFSEVSLFWLLYLIPSRHPEHTQPPLVHGVWVPPSGPTGQTSIISSPINLRWSCCCGYRDAGDATSASGWRWGYRGGSQVEARTAGYR